MAYFVNFHGTSLFQRGAYSFTQVAQGAPSDAQLGIVALIGEANEGPAWAAETTGLDAVTFNPSQYGAIVQKYGSGPLVDAARLALSPAGDDPDIKGGAQTLVLMKTNQSVKAQLALAGSYGTIKAKKAGTPGNLTTVTITGGSSTRVVTVNRADLGISEVSSALGNVPVLTIQMTDSGPSATTLTISATAITTSVTGGTISNLNIPIGLFSTIADLVTYINSIGGYVASVATATQAQQPPSVLDRVSAQDIKTSAYSVKRDAKDIQDFFATSQLVDFTPGSGGYAGLPTAIAQTFLSGGALGATTQAQFQTALDALGAINVNFIVPLFSRDASADISAGLTDSSSTYLIASVQAAVRSHVAQQSQIRGRRERQGFVAQLDDSFTNIRAAAATLGAGRVSLFFQEVKAADASGTLDWRQPHMLAVIAASMKAAAPVGLSNLFKLANISGFKTRNSSGSAYFDPATDADTAIQANLTFVEAAPGGGFRFAIDNSTYGLTANNWFYGFPSVIYAADVAARTIRLNLETFVGKRNSDISKSSIENFVATICDKLRAAGILVADTASKGKGYKDIVATINGNTVNVSVTLVIVESVEYVLADLNITRAVA